MKELGVEKAKKYLDAHENDPDQPASERAMDLHNNEQGVRASQSLMSRKTWSMEKLESKGLDELRAKKLDVIKPGLTIPKELK